MTKSDCVIRVENLSKCYKLGQIHHNQLGELIGERCQKILHKIHPRIRRQMVKTRNEAVVYNNTHPYDSKTLNHVRPLYSVHKNQKFQQDLSNSSKLDKFWALRNLSFEINRGEVVGIIGLNGAGKSTLLKILARITEPTEGRAWMKGRVASLLEVGTGFHPELTGRENIYLNGTLLGMSRIEIKRKFDEIIEFAEVQRFLDTPVKRYSSGMYVRLAFAIAAHLEPEILLIDEVLAVGDASFQQRCLGKMQQVTNEGRTILFVSHNMLTVQSLCPRTILLKSGSLLFQGDTNSALSRYLQQNKLTSHPKVDLHHHNRRPSQFKPVFQTIRILNEELKESSTIPVGDSIIFELGLKTNKAILNSPLVLIELRDMQGIPICQFSSQEMSATSFKESSSYLLRCIWKACCLVQGSYTINLELRNDNESIDMVKNAASICVKKTEQNERENIFPSSGFIIPDQQWEFGSSRESEVYHI